MTRLQIIIPCHANEDADIALRSLEEQSFKDFEVTIVRDVEAKGAPWARNKGFDLIKDKDSEFVLFSDNDLRWYPNSLQLLVETLDKHPEASYAYGAIRLDENVFCNREFNAASLKQGNYIHTSSLIRMKDFPRYDEDVKRLQDWDLWLNMLINHGKVGIYCGQEIFETHQRSGGISVDGSISLNDATHIIHKKYKLMFMNVQLIMPAINLWTKYTKPAIESVNEAMVRAKDHGIDCHFILIDNASTDETKEEASKMISELFSYVRNEERWGFQKTVNFGIKDTFDRGYDIAFVLNNDIILHPEAIWRIVERFEKGGVNMVSCMDVRGEMRENGIQPCDISRILSKEKETVDEAPHPSFSAFAIDKECWETVGEFDEIFAPAYYEDNCFHYRMKLVGLLAIVYPPAMFYHFGSRTQNEANESGQPMVPTPLFENNCAFYVKKWGGVPGQEKWEHPYNDMLAPITKTKQTVV